MQNPESPATESPAVWQIRSGARLHWRAWQEEWVVYDDESGNTHLIDSLASQVLRQLDRSPLQTDRLIDALTAAHESRADGVGQGDVHRTLFELERLGLIVQKPG